MPPTASNIVNPQAAAGVNQPHNSRRRDFPAAASAFPNNRRAIRSDGSRGVHECISFIIKFFPA